jgi:uncharacterized membrane-anchored protein YjiN (DUF445 family)
MAEEDEAERRKRAELRNHRLFATGLLGVAALGLIASHFSPVETFWIGLARAGTEAALVGGLADWFAVTALFRRPLGLPIPHTALVPRNKDRIGESLASFVERNFLAPDLVAGKLRSLRLAERFARWLARRRTAEMLADRVLAAAPFALETLEDRSLRDFVRRALREQLDDVDFAPLLARVLGVLREQGHHQRVFDQGLRVARRLLAENEDRIYDAVSQKTPWWAPRTVDRRIAEAIVAGVLQLLDDKSEPGHEARRRLEAALADLIARLETSAKSREAVAAMKAQILDNPAVQDYLGSLWDALKRLLLDDVRSPQSRLRGAMVDGLRALGHALAQDREMQARLDRRLELFAAGALAPFRAEIGGFIAEVVRSWDARTVAERLELEVGRDLQYVRMNGTVVGALVGCALYLGFQFVPAFVS